MAGTGAGTGQGARQARWFDNSSQVDAFMAATPIKKRQLEVLKEQLTYLTQQHGLPRTKYSENGKKLKPEELANKLKRKLEQVYPPSTIASTTAEGAPQTTASETVHTTVDTTASTTTPTAEANAQSAVEDTSEGTEEMATTTNLEATKDGTVPPSHEDTGIDIHMGGTESGGTQQEQVTQPQQVTQPNQVQTTAEPRFALLPGNKRARLLQQAACAAAQKL